MRCGVNFSVGIILKIGYCEYIRDHGAAHTLVSVIQTCLFLFSVANRYYVKIVVDR